MNKPKPPPDCNQETFPHSHYPPPVMIFNPAPQKLINGYPRWNRYRRLHRSHLRMNNVDWAIEDDEEDDDKQYQYPPHPYPYPYPYPYPCPSLYPSPKPPSEEKDDPFAPPMDDEYSCDSYPTIIRKKESRPTTPVSEPDRLHTNNDERWTVATSTNDDDCSCISGETNLSQDVHNYFVG